MYGILARIVGILFVVQLTACGGSGGSDSSQDSVTPTDSSQTDVTPPVITLNGDSSIVLNQPDSYVELGATATDDQDGDVDVIISGSVDTGSLGSYEITYTASDSANNTSSLTRIVTVQLSPDITPPMILLNGDSSIVLNQPDSYVELGATATDDQDGDVDVIISGSVDTGSLGSYEITYTASDSANNTSSLTRIVTVQLSPDITPPMISLNGESTIQLALGESYIEQGATATDDRDSDIEVSLSGTVDVDTTGNYSITYTAIDNAGNTSNLTRIVTIVELRPLIMTWKTDIADAFSDENQIMIDTDGTGYDYKVDWGDGTFDENVTGDIVHTYTSVGTYTVTISGSFPQIYFEQAYSNGDEITYNSDHNKLVSLEQWGDTKWRSMKQAFRGCSNFVSNATDIPDLSGVTEMQFMFYGASAFNQDISGWDVSNVTNMLRLFSEASAFNQDISGWDVSNVTDMRAMFDSAMSFNQSINNWDVSKVTAMTDMFFSAKAFNQDLSSWDVSNVTNMSALFSGAESFNQDIGNWDVSKVETMSFMFYNAKAFNQDISNWDISRVENMSSMFVGADSFDQDLSNWNL